MQAGSSRFVYISDSDPTVPAELGQESQASSCLRKGTPLASRVVQGVSGPSSCCAWNLRVFPDDAQGSQCPFVLCFPHRVAFEEVSGHRVLIKSGPENRGRSARGTSHVASLEFPRETGLLLRCAGKAGNPFKSTQGNCLSCHDQQGRRGSEEAVPGPSVFPSGEPGVSGDFWGSQEGCQGPGSSEGKTSACNVGDPGSIPGSGRSPGEGNSNPLQYSCLENPRDKGACRASPRGHKESDTTERLHFHVWSYKTPRVGTGVEVPGREPGPQMQHSGVLLDLPV